MKKIFTFLAAAALIAGCSKTDEAPTSSYTITGYSTADTRTEFGEPNAETIPFLWSKGDKVWVGSQQSDALAAGGESATFTLSSAPQDGDAVYYNMTGSGATASVPTAQDAANSLGANGDFGYATLSGNSFALEHATSYLWFDIAALPSGATLKSIRLHAGDAIVAGSATWNGSAFGAVSNGRSIIDLAVNKTSVSGAEVAMVVLPTAITNATITYELSVSGTTKFYEQTLGAKDIEAGTTYKISVDLATVSLTDYVLRTLTFEDNHALFEAYTFENQESGDSYSISKWSNLIPEQDYFDNLIYTPTYTGTNEYNWTDTHNTNIHHEFPETTRGRHYNAAGHALSKSFTRDYTAYGTYSYELYVYEDGAHSGNNCCVHHGYDDAGRPMGALAGFEFNDGKARVIDHMYVANTSYGYNQLFKGHGYGSSYQNGPTDDSWFKITAYGYESADDTTPTTLDFYLLNTGKQFVTDWTKWDLTGLGAVVKVEFNMFGSADMGSPCGLGSPGYFAYDDVAVQWK